MSITGITLHTNLEAATDDGRSNAHHGAAHATHGHGGRRAGDRAVFRGNRAFLAPWEPKSPDGFYTDEFWAEQVRRNREHAENGRALRMFIFPHDAPGEVMGTVSFTEIVRGIFQACYLGYALSGAREGQGYMREALGAAIAHAFGPLRLHRIMANYLPHNRRSGNVLRALGFTVEGYARDYLRVNGRWEDHVLTSLTNPAWDDADVG